MLWLFLIKLEQNQYFFYKWLVTETLIYSKLMLQKCGQSSLLLYVLPVILFLIKCLEKVYLQSDRNIQMPLFVHPPTNS